MKTEFDFDPSKLFGGKHYVHATIKMMDFPFLVNHAFNCRNGVYDPEALQVVLARCFELFVEDMVKPDQLRDVLMRTVKAARSDSGIFGLGKLPIDELVDGRSYVSTEVGITGAKLRLRRYGDSLALRPVNDRDETHEKMASILGQIVGDGRCYLRHFIQRYGFTLTPDLKGTGNNAYVLDVQAELAVMNRYLPDIRWSGGKKLAALLGADFTGHERAGVKVGTYGDAEVFARITYERETNDPDWRLGKVRSTTATELMFGAGAGDKPQIEYFIQTVEPDHSFDPARGDIDYPREQGLMHDLARMLYAGLYQRGFQSMVDHGNQHFLRFQRESEQAAA